MSNLNSRSNLNPRQFSNGSMSVDVSIASPTESQSIEVSGLMDDFISIEEFAPGSNWEEVLAANWGIPCAAQPENIKPSQVSKRLDCDGFNRFFRACG